MPIEGFNNGNQGGGQQPSFQTNLTNNSGAGKDSPVLDIVADRFNWGAFFFSWIWGLFNKTYIPFILFIIPLLVFIPIINIFTGIIQLGLCIWFGINGNKWAWQNKRWNSIEHFHAVQKKWAIASILYLVVCFVLGLIIGLTVPTLTKNIHVTQQRAIIKKSIVTATEVVEMNEVLDRKCDLSSEGLAECFAERMNITEKSGTTVKVADGSIFTFQGDGKCLKSGSCSITVNANLLNSESISPVVIPLYIKPNGHLEIKSIDIDKYIH